MSFSTELAQKIRDSNIANISVYIESFPAPKDIITNIVCIATSGKLVNGQDRRKEIYTRRFIISGSLIGAMNKAFEILNYFIPKLATKPGFMTNTAFRLATYNILTVLEENEPAPVKNVGNIFFVNFTLKFIVIS